jgi:hypothetical protein
MVGDHLRVHSDAFSLDTKLGAARKQYKLFKRDEVVFLPRIIIAWVCNVGKGWVCNIAKDRVTEGAKSRNIVGNEHF